MNLRSALLILGSYLIGSIPFGVILGKLIARVDVRAYGSGNTGATNVLRTLGFGFAFATFLLDAGKGAVVAYSARALMLPAAQVGMAGIAVVAGHDWPVFLGFKGGKGIAATFGFLMVASPLAGLTFALVWLAVVVPTRYASLGSIVASITAPIVAYIVTSSVQMSLACAVLAVFAVWRHRSNISRLLSGTESKFGERVR